MRAPAVCLAGLTLAASAAGIGAQQRGQEPVFRTGIETVPVYATVLGEDGRLVTALERTDFEVFDNGRPQPITLFDNGIQPISIVIMLDMSGSMAGNLPTLRSAAVQMFTRLLPQDRAKVGNFGDRITLSSEFTNDENTLIRALWLDLEPGGGTPLWGAINVAMTALTHFDGRRVVLVLSDGKDTSRYLPGAGGPSLESVIRRAQTEEYMVYAIGMRSRGGPSLGFGRGGRGGRGGGRRPPGNGDEPDPGLRELAAESGGGYFELTGTDALGPLFAQVADELHRQYLIGFKAPEADGKLHAIDVRVTRQGATVRARRNYLAPARRQAP
jgi:Ca-activated chloride channel homolog